MWKVRFSANAEALIRKLIKEGRISESDRQVIGAWMRLVELHGPEALREQRRWDDHALEHEWAGFRSSAYSPAGRIIYKVVEDKIVVVVVRITPDHDYGTE